MSTADAPKQTVLVVSEEGFSWFLIASALDRRALELEWHRTPEDLAEAVRAVNPDLIVMGEVGGDASTVLETFRRAARLGPTVIALDVPRLGVALPDLLATGCLDAVPVGVGTDELRARLLAHLGLVATREPRLRIARPAVLELSGRRFPGSTVDLSSGGAALRLLGPFRPGDAVFVTLEISPGSPVRCPSKVLRVQGDVVAVRFTDLDPRDRERLEAMVRRGVRDRPALLDGAPRLIDVLVQARRGLTDVDPPGPLPADWLGERVAGLSLEDREALAAFDPSAFTTRSEVMDDRALLLACRVGLAYWDGRLREWGAMSPALQGRVAGAVRSQLAAAERVFKDVALRVVNRRGEATGAGEDVAPAQRALLEVALAARDRFNALAGDQPAAAFPALQVPDDYFRTVRAPRPRAEASGNPAPPRAPRRGGFEAVVPRPHPALAWLRGASSPARGWLPWVLVAALVALVVGRGGAAPRSAGALSAEQIARFGGLIAYGEVVGEPPGRLRATLDATRWRNLDDAGRSAALEGVRARLPALEVGRADLVDADGRVVAVVEGDPPAR